MKTRFGFVSNSSSSSFIIKNDPAFAEIAIEDWYRMIRDLYENYGDAMMKRIESATEYGSKLRDVFSVFDLAYDRDEAVAEIGGALACWDASNAAIHNGVMERVNSDPSAELECFIDEMEEEIRSKYSAGYVRISLFTMVNEDEDYGNSTIIAQKDGKNIEVPNSQDYIDRIKAKMDEIGICNNLQVLKNEQSRFAIHLDDNECWNIKGFESDEEEWESEVCTYERLCEIFTKWLKEHDKIPQDFDWRKMLELTLTVCMHEG